MPNSRPPGTTSPLLALSPTDQRGVLAIATTLGMIFSCFTILIRVCVRVNPRSRCLWDDVTSVATMLVSLAQSGVILLAIIYGFGKTVQDAPPADVIAWQKAVYTADILFIVTMWMTKCSTAFIFVRMSAKKSHHRAAFAAIGTSTVFMLISVLLLALKCGLASPWIFFRQTCVRSISTWWILVASLDVVSELLLFSLSIHPVGGLHLRLARKLAVVAVFGARLLLRGALESADPSLYGVGAALCVQAEICIALVSTAAVALKPFIAALGTGYGGAGATTVAAAPGRTDGARGWASRTLSISNRHKHKKLATASYALESYASRRDGTVTSQSRGSVICGAQPQSDTVQRGGEFAPRDSLARRSGHDGGGEREINVVYEGRGFATLQSSTSHQTTISWVLPTGMPMEHRFVSTGGILTGSEWSVAVGESHEAPDKPT